jgi:hypothetical protein
MRTTRWRNGKETGKRGTNIAIDHFQRDNYSQKSKN